MSEEQKTLWQSWNQFCSEQQKAALAKGTVGHTGRWEERRREFIVKLIRAGLMTKDGYTVIFV